MFRSLLDECERLGIEAPRVKIIHLLHQQGEASLGHIATALGDSEEETARKLGQLIGKHLVTSPANQIYELAEAGRATANRM